MDLKSKLPPVLYIDSELADLMPEFLANRRKDLVNLDNALKSKNWDEIGRIAHIVSGVCGGYGFSGFGELGAEIEQLVPQRAEAQIAQILQVMKTYFAEVRIVFK